LGSLCDGLEQIGVKQIFGLIGEEAESVGLPPFRKGIEFPIIPTLQLWPVPAAVRDLPPESLMN
jgi:hypothetical protein